MRVEALQDVDEVIEGIYAMQLATSDKGLNDSDRMRADFGPAEEPVFLPKGRGLISRSK